MLTQYPSSSQLPNGSRDPPTPAPPQKSPELCSHGPRHHPGRLGCCGGRRGDPPGRRCPRTHRAGFLFQPGCLSTSTQGRCIPRRAEDQTSWFSPVKHYAASGPFSVVFATSRCCSSQAQRSPRRWGSLRARRDGCLNILHEKRPSVETSEPLLVPNDPNILLFRADHKAAPRGRDANGPGAGEGKAQRAFATGFIVSPVAFYQQIFCNTLRWASGYEKVPGAMRCAKGASDDDDDDASLHRASGVRGRCRRQRYERGAEMAAGLHAD
ncbi:uncharacterized protein ACIBXB_013440 [Morphnus guianensis]